MRVNRILTSHPRNPSKKTTQLLHLEFVPDVLRPFLVQPYTVGVNDWPLDVGKFEHGRWSGDGLTFSDCKTSEEHVKICVLKTGITFICVRSYSIKLSLHLIKFRCSSTDIQIHRHFSLFTDSVRLLPIQFSFCQLNLVLTESFQFISMH